MHIGERQRVIELGGVRNLRDVGGYPTTTENRRTRWRTLYRSGCLDELDEAGQRWLIDAGLRTVIDLRDSQEVAERPNVFASSSHVKYTRMPFFDGPPPDGLIIDLRLGYRREVDELGEHLARLVETLVTPGVLPALVHCAAGKDRTGVAIGVVLAALGTVRSSIAEDYALSQHCMGPDFLTSAREWVLSRGYDWEVWEHVAYTPPERMVYTLAYVDEQYGGVERYLQQHGLALDRLADLRELLTERPY